ncbi:hypothetical protein BAUCODRAFT_51703, partial [Baudoinia panamericana UAMH 10762]
QECRAHHYGYNEGTTNWMPTRLLEVRVPGNPAHVRVVPTQSQIHCYVALRYCWGTEGQPMTKTDKINIHQTGLELASLPPTIRDAVFVTRQLGVHYIWVDSLCIVRDEQQDKMAEIEMMRMIYRNAVCTIVVSSS